MIRVFKDNETEYGLSKNHQFPLNCTFAIKIQIWHKKGLLVYATSGVLLPWKLFISDSFGEELINAQRTRRFLTWRSTEIHVDGWMSG